MKVLVSTVALLALLALAGTAAAQPRPDSIHPSASARTAAGAPWRTEAWATAKLRTVRYWHGYRLDDHEFDMVSGNGWSTPYNRDGESLFRSFDITMNSAGYNSRHFYATLHTSRSGGGFYITPGWSG
jgi:hypothetical protein